MKLINKRFLQATMGLGMLFIFLGLYSCNDKYPDLGDGLYAEIVTSKGTMVAKLYFDKTPVTVANFVALAEGVHPMVKDEYKNKKYYDSTIFHRVIDKFMIQGGDPTATGSGDPGYRFDDEFHPDLRHSKPGILSMANSGPGSNGSQFFITEVPTPHLDFRHAVFGELVEGLDVLDSISNVKTAERDKPVEDVVIEHVNIIRKGSDAQKFDAPKVFQEEHQMIANRQKALQEEFAANQEKERAAKEEKNKEAGQSVRPMLDDYYAKTDSTASGLRYFIIKEGEGPKPNAGASVKLNYEGYYPDGRLFDSNVKEVETRHGMYNEMKDEREMYSPMQMSLTPDAAMIAGFKEAVNLMKVGDKGYFFLPAHIAFGQKGNGAIPPDQPLVFIIEMTEIVE
ncbi:peptidylprolyl isomerase [Aegicerativicinus sediminis]|uniref:peptidylprolyl isomerase n=1 Tax=Aegicerativicinus sediminis TaxID=2893202 RepID=UPI001E4A3715|nr:peptidylprolyl isomerase [Aegicerativicinus sediminis]